MWVKICGITRHEDAAAAVRLGADALGFVFAESPRRVSRELVAPWITEIRGVEKVAVFTDEETDEIMEICGGLGMDAIQLHAPASAGHARLLERHRIIYAMEEYRPGILPAFPCRILIDASGGKGIQGHWKGRDVPYILAGGLTPDNVRRAILTAGPAGVDVSSGVESSPGIKDPGKMEKFIREAKS
jgi:phosphoribosylanthranilate isomerase